MSPSPYRNLTISGKIGVGSTTLYNSLKEKLAPLGWTFFSGGEFMRDYAITNHLIDKNGPHHPATAYSDEVDIKMDTEMARRLKEESKLAIEADLAGFMARDIPHVLRILLVCDDILRIDRLVNRDHMTVDEAKQHIKNRERINTEKWTRLYGKYHYWDPKFYTLVIDTYRSSPHETLNQVLRELDIA